jgi:hypothetical protein
MAARSTISVAATSSYRLSQPELGTLLQAARQLLPPAGQQATEEADTTARTPSGQIDEKPTGPQLNSKIEKAGIGPDDQFLIAREREQTQGSAAARPVGWNPMKSWTPPSGTPCERWRAAS